MSFTGERVTSEAKGQIETEHLHRYFLAREFCRGRDVLDIASGEGYGSAYLARIARSVVGIDVDPTSVAHAAAGYPYPNLRYQEGSVERIPLEDGSLDVVVSFETIEHVYDQDQFLSEVRRVLRPGGLFISSTPDRDVYSSGEGRSNPFHVRELTRDEYRSLLTRYFANAHVMFQRAMVGSVICSETSTDGVPLLIEKRGDAQFEASRGMARSTYMISLASDDDLPPATTSCYVETSRLDAFVAGAEAEHLRRQLADFGTLATTQETHLSAALGEIQAKNLRIADLESGTASRDDQIRAALDDARAQELRLADKDLQLADLEARTASREDELRAALARTQAELAESDASLRRAKAEASAHRRLVAALQREVLAFGASEVAATGTAVVRPAPSDRDIINHIRTFRRESQRERGTLEQASRAVTQQGAYIKACEALVRHAVAVTPDFVSETGAIKASLDPDAMVAERADFACVFDAAYYADQNSDVCGEGMALPDHFLEHGWQEGRDPSPLFSLSWYLEQRADVAESGINPLIHFLAAPDDPVDPHPLFDVAHYKAAAAAQGVTVEGNPLVHFIREGGARGIDPHPYFNVRFYLDQVTEPSRGLIDPLSHYLRVGSGLGLWPNPAFDPRFYTAAHAEAAESGIDPLVHYIRYGEPAGLKPSETFDPQAYLVRNPDVAAGGQNPIQHYLRYGFQEGRVAEPARRIVPGDLKASPHTLARPDRQVTVIVPVYRGLDETRRCIVSVLRSLPMNLTPSRLLLIDDCGPEPALSAYLAEMSGSDGVTVTRNAVNLGFVASVNHGMAAAGSDDVILLNSDTEVHGDWIDRLAAHAHAAADVGTVTPFSNNATVFSYPTLTGSASLPWNESVASMDEAFREGNLGRSTVIPTAVGFCMYIRRDCLDDVGPFDQARFGKGYGEENDFCRRAIRLGWVNSLAADTFVYHIGETSFGEQSTPGKTRAADILRELYPDYERSVDRFVQSNVLEPFRMAATAALCRRQNRPVVLMIMHGFGGGTVKHVEELAASIDDTALPLMLELVSVDQHRLKLRLYTTDEIFRFDYAVEAQDAQQAAEFLSLFGIRRVHIHHTFGTIESSMRIVSTLGVPYDLTVHDFYLVCPRINLLMPDGRYCGLANDAQCMDCLAAKPAAQTMDIIWWRVQGIRMLRNAATVICPSQSTADLLTTLLPRPYKVVHHDAADATVPVDNVRPIEAGKPLQLAVIGVLARHKGAEFLFDVLKACNAGVEQVELSIVGRVEPEYEQVLGNVSGLRYVSGAYKPQHVGSLIALVDPHLLIYPQRWPETYSYTLSEGIRSGRPILAPATGAFVERLRGRPWTWLYDLSSTVTDMVALLGTIRQELEAGHPAVAARDAEGLPHQAVFGDYYPGEYIENLKLEVRQ